MLTTLLASFLLASTPEPSQSWNLQPYGFQPHYYVSSLAVFRQRAFLALPRTSCYNRNTSNPTLIELPWSGESTDAIPRTRVWLLDIKRQTWGECRELQDAISVDVEAKKGRLWVLDRGSDGFCEGKIVVFSLFYNYEVGVSVLEGVRGGDLAGLVVDPAANAQRVYVGGLEGEILMVCAASLKWKRVKLEREQVFTDSLAVSRNKAMLFVTSTRSDDLFSVNLSELDKEENSTRISANVTYHGQKLGPSSGIATDFKYGLIYYLKRDFAIVRWDTRKELKAEYHRVLYQSYKYLPYVSQIFTGPQMSVWALVNPANPATCNPNNSTEEFSVPEDLPDVKSRVFKLLRFNQRNNE